MKGMTHEQAKGFKESIVKYRLDGHFAEEAAEHFGVSLSYVYNASKGYSCPKNSEASKKGASEWGKKRHAENYCERERKAIQMIAERLPGFEYAGGYIDMNSSVALRCKKCGSYLQRSMISVRQKMVACERCRETMAEQAALEKQAEKEERRARAIQNKINRETELSNKTRAVECVECGKIFLTRRERQVCCSSECTRKRDNRRASHRKDARISIDKRVDRDITTRGLFLRDEGVCWICGEQCDIYDYKEINGVIVCGEYYPSIDHIVPISDGGEDSWDNVKLAHRRCNTLRFWKKTPPPVA